MRMEQLGYLIELNTSKSLTKASEKLHISRQALSKGIKTLEDELQVELLVRTVKGVAFTSKGEELLGIAKDIAMRMDGFNEHSLPYGQPQLKDEVKILTVHALKSAIMADLASAFYLAYPRSKLIVESYSRDEISALMAQGYADMGFVNQMTGKLAHLNVISDQIDFYPLFEAKPFVWVNAHSPIARLKSVSMSTVVKYPLIIDKLADLTLLYGGLNPYGKPKRIIEVDDMYQIYQLAADNLAIVMDCQVLYHSSVSCHSETYKFFSDKKELVAVPIKVDFKVYTGYLVNKEKNTSTEIQAILSLLNNL